jgi:hypothetical protein
MNPGPFIVPDRSDLPEADLVASIAIGGSASGLLVTRVEFDGRQ